MINERRKFNRVPVQISASLSLRRNKTGEIISTPVQCRLFDISKSGAGIYLSQVMVNSHHLFFDALESDDCTLFLEIDTLLPVRPVWFDRELDKEDNPFKMGLEFREKLSSEKFQIFKNISA